MVGLADVLMGVQVVLLAAISFGSYYGRKLDMRLHHRLIYGTVAVQALIFFFWMGPSVSFWRDNGGFTALLGFHVVTGAISGICCIVLVVIFLARGNEYDLPLLRWTRPLMIFTYFMWVISFIFGFLVYLDFHIYS